MVCQGCGAEVIPGDRWTSAHAAAWSAEHSGHQPARSLVNDVREALRDVEGVREVRAAALGDGARVEATSMVAADDVRRVLSTAGWVVTEIGYVTMVRAKNGEGDATPLDALRELADGVARFCERSAAAKGGEA